MDEVPAVSKPKFAKYSLEWNALDEISQIYVPSHLSEQKTPQNVRYEFNQFLSDFNNIYK